MEFIKSDYEDIINDFNKLGQLSYTDDDDYNGIVDETIELFKNTFIPLELCYKKTLYSKCHHVLAHINDSTYCIKCGLDDSFTDDPNSFVGIDTYACSDKEFAMAITSHIVRQKPTIASKQLATEFNETLEDIRKNEQPKFRCHKRY